jgi:hypothetical protein
MNRFVLGGGFAACVLGIMCVGATSLPVSGNSDSVAPSMQQLCERDVALTQLQNRVIARMDCKAELIREFMHNEISFNELAESWIWLNDKKPYYPVAMEVNYPGMTAKQIAITQILQVLAQRVMIESRFDEFVERGLEFQVFEAAVKEQFSY